MLPQLIKSNNRERSLSLNLNPQNHRRQNRKTSHYSSVIMEKLQQPSADEHSSSPGTLGQKAFLIVLVQESDDFLKYLMSHARYGHFLKYKEFLNRQQLDSFLREAAELFVSQFSDAYRYFYCSFSQANLQIDLEQSQSKEIYEVLFEFAERQGNRKFNFIFGVDLQILHKSAFRSIFILSELRLDQMLMEYLNPLKFRRYYTQLHNSNEPALTQENQEESPELALDSKIQQVGAAKKNKEIKQFLIEQNKRRQLRSKSKELMVNRVFQKPERPPQVPLELPQICEQVYQRFMKIFRIEHIKYDGAVFSQFLLLCELSIFYSKNKQLHISIHHLPEQERLSTLIENVLFFDYKILKTMNHKLQHLTTTITKTFLRFLKQGKEYENQNRLNWHDFLRFKQYYIDIDWPVSDLRLFLLLLNDESSLTVQRMLKLNAKETQKAILTMDSAQLQLFVFQLLLLSQ